jgi:GNAT superfamily N-acetyltransferase
MITFKKLSLKELWTSPNFPELIVQYEAESSSKHLPPVSPQYEMYSQFEEDNSIIFVGAFDNDTLIGFTVTTISYYLHYDGLAADTESLFVLKGYRKGGTGKRLVQAAELYAKQVGAEFFFITAPVGGALEKAARLFGYEKANTSFIKVLK